MSKEGIKEAAIAPIRTVRVTYSPPVTDPKVVRFQGTSFGQLHERLLAAKVPGVDGKSYIELLVPGEGFVCPLPGEALPNFSEITISVQAEARGPPAGAAFVKSTEPVTGRPVPAQEASVRGAAGPSVSDLDKRFARKEAKMQQKLGKITAKLGALRTKHDILLDREEENGIIGSFSDGPHHRIHGPHGHHHHHHHRQHHRHGENGCVGGYRHPSSATPHTWGQVHHPNPRHPSAEPAEGRPIFPGLASRACTSHGADLARQDPSGANCQSDLVGTGKI